MRMKEAQQRVDDWIGEFSEGYWPPLVNLARIAEEVGELAREVNHLYGPKAKKPTESDSDLELEVGDVLFALICLANSVDVDLERALGRTLAKYRARDSHRWARKDRDDA